MSEYKFDEQHNYGFPLTFEASGKYPLIAKRIFATYSDAEAFANDDSTLGTAVAGLVITVINDDEEYNNGAYRIAKVGTNGSGCELEKLGGPIDCGTWDTTTE